MDERTLCEQQCSSDCCEKVAYDRPKVLEAKMDHVKARQIYITQLDFGYSVNVGCQTFAIESLDTVLNMVDKYLHDPDKLEKEWRDGTLKIGGKK